MGTWGRGWDHPKELEVIVSGTQTGTKIVPKIVPVPTGENGKPQHNQDLEQGTQRP